MEQSNIIVRIATSSDIIYANTITAEMDSSAQVRGTGIAKRSAEYIIKKIEEGKAVIALTEENVWVGFCYIEAWGHEEFVANSGLIVAPAFQENGNCQKYQEKNFQFVPGKISRCKNIRAYYRPCCNEDQQRPGV